MLALPPFSFLLCLSPFFLPPAEKNGGPEGFHPKASLEPSFCSLLWRVFVWLCPFFHGPPPILCGRWGRICS